ncbi:TIGR02147 family protein [Bdellovibrio sp. HCB-110]|uniref:TIGR02147 family protein n=1 Tax=Bdellovibrio sp. HCB-110 TaxID=3391182 RepID=UPI0039B5FB16
MAHIFEYKDYKVFLSTVLKSNSSQRGLQSAMARHLGCQASYLYQILKGKADLTEDQAFKVTTFLKFAEVERDFFMCLVRFAKASSPELRQFLSGEIERKIKSHQDLKNRIQADNPPNNDDFWEHYFATLIPSHVHILTSSKKYQTVKSLSQKLNLPEDEILRHLKQLQSMKMVDYKDKKWVYLSSSIHFAKDSRFNLQMQKNRRIQSLSALNEALTSEDTHFSSLFTLDPDSLKKLQSLIADFVQNSHSIVHRGGTDEAYVLNLDLFEI